MAKEIEKTSKTVLIGRDAYMYLNREQRRQRGCKPLTEKQEDSLWKAVSEYPVAGKARVNNNSFGGGDGTYYGSWWSWPLETVKRMLSEAGFSYEEGPEYRYMDA